MQLKPEDERTMKRILRATLRNLKKPDPGPDVTVEALLEMVRDRRQLEPETPT